MRRHKKAAKKKEPKQAQEKQEKQEPEVRKRGPYKQTKA
jgi:hypothetical protein